MKKIIILLVAFSAIVIACNNSKNGDEKAKGPGTEEKTSGRDEEIVKDVLNDFKKYTINEDYEGMMKLISPTLLKEVSKEELADQLRQGTHTEQYDILIHDIIYEDVSEILKKDGNKYALAKTRTSGGFRLKSDDLFERFCESAKTRFTKVSCNEDENVVNFEMKGEAYVLYTTEDKRWFIVSDTDPRSVRKLIPADIREKLGIRVGEDDE